MNQNYNNQGNYQQNPYQQNPYQQPQQPQQPMDNPGKGLGIAGFIAAMVSLASCIIGGVFLGLPTAIAGIILSSIGRKKSAEVGMSNGLGTAGFVIGIISTVLWGILLLFALIGAAWLESIGVDVF